MAFLISSKPIISLTSPSFCSCLSFTGLLHMGGTYMWGTWIALFRVLFVTSQDLLKKKIGVDNLLRAMIIAGIFEVA